MWPVGTKLKVVRNGDSGHYVRIGSIVILGGTYRSQDNKRDLYACVVDPVDLEMGAPHNCAGFFKAKIGRAFHRDELEPVLIPEDEDDLYI